MNKSDSATTPVQDFSAVTLSNRNQDETLTAPSTTNTAGEQPADCPPTNQSSASADLPSLQPATNGGTLSEQRPLPGGGTTVGPHPPVSAVGERFDEETETAALAYRYYEEEGRPEGRAQEHWARAEQVVRGRHAADPDGTHPPTNPSAADDRAQRAMTSGA